jgi:hypothetical protein
MKKLLLASILVLPSIFFGQDLDLEPTQNGRAVALVCQSKGAGPASPITIAFSAGANYGSEIYNGVISSMGVQVHTFPLYLENETKSSTQFSVSFSNEGAAPEQSIKGSISVDLKEVTIDGQVVRVPSGSGVVDLSIKPEVGPTVKSQYLLSKCEGIVK